MKMRLLPAFAGLAICFALQIFAEEKESTPSASAPLATPTPTLGDHDTQVLPDRHVTFRLLAPKANAVKVMIGVKSGVYEGQGTTVTEMTKQENGFWTVTFCPFDPDLYEYKFDIDGVMLPDPGNDMPKPERHVGTSLLLIPGTPRISWTNKPVRMELCGTRPTIRQRSARTDMSWSTPRRPTTVQVHSCPSFIFTTGFLIHAIHG
jgi:hypothetical protein